MQYQLFINSIINRKCGNVRPFSPVFNASDLKVVKDKVLKGAVPDPEFERMYEAFVEVSKLMKFAYDDLYAKQNQVLEEMKTPAFDVYSHLIAIANHNYGFIYEKLNSLLENKKGSIQLFSVLSAAKIESIDKKVGLLHLDGALEGQIDSLTMLRNGINY